MNTLTDEQRAQYHHAANLLRLHLDQMPFLHRPHEQIEHIVTCYEITNEHRAILCISVKFRTMLITNIARLKTQMNTRCEQTLTHLHMCMEGGADLAVRLRAYFRNEEGSEDMCLSDLMQAEGESDYEAEGDHECDRSFHCAVLEKEFSILKKARTFHMLSDQVLDYIYATYPVEGSSE